MSQQNITAIVPAYNEEATIAQVVTALLASPLLTDVLVISDGSTDATAARAREAGAQVHEMPRQGGKGEAMLHALIHTDAPIVVFFDADLLGLTPDHVEQLVRPVLNGSRVMNVGLRDRGIVLTQLTRHLPLIAGERALHRSIIERTPAQYLKGFMVEASLNYYCRSHGLPYGAVKLSGLSIRHKYEKVGWPLAVLQYGRMFFQVATAMVTVRVARVRGKF
ncbi:glycosyltransferase [Candidatus Uhrbacteria bacterium]|nr:glycosyltransferase [Candidatus Uhrbacteria bacterium]